MSSSPKPEQQNETQDAPLNDEELVDKVASPLHSPEEMKAPDELVDLMEAEADGKEPEEMADSIALRRKQRIVSTLPKKKGRLKPIPSAPPFDRLQDIVDNWAAVTGREPDDQYKFVFIAGYLFAGRISETLGLKRASFTVFKKMVNGEVKTFLQANIFTLKRRQGDETPRYRRVVAPMFGYTEKMAIALWGYVQNFDTKELVFPYGGKPENARIAAHQVFHSIDFGAMEVEMPDGATDYVDEWHGSTHLLRHIRLTHLYVFHGFSERAIIAVAGWKSGAMVGKYVHVGVNEMVGHFVVGGNQPG